jgi:glutamate-1-semialdehyde 2,1-aminomutase
MSAHKSSGLSTIAIVQARLGSVRMPGKVLEEVIGKPLIAHLVSRLKRSEGLDQVVLAIPSSSVNDELALLADQIGIGVARGSELDVLDRFASAARQFPANSYVRITGDCPLVDPNVVGALIRRFNQHELDYACTGLSFPDGLDVEVFKSSVLFEASEKARDNFDREHVTPWMKRATHLKAEILEHTSDLSRLRLTIDEPEDFEVLSGIFSHYGGRDFGLTEIELLAQEQPALFVGNQHLRRNEGSAMGTGQKLWSRAQRVIPGGNMLLSKKAEMFLPKGWPSYFNRTAGCAVWDMDGSKYLDVGFMGIGTNVLGYSHPQVDDAVKEVITLGNLSTLNCPEEVYLAEKLCEMHPWAEMVKFTRSGGEAAAVALRIARAASGKDQVAFCGYHGWHDWYLSANLERQDALNNHLLAGLSPGGVPLALAGTAHAFDYNDHRQLESILLRGDIGVVFIEVERNFAPAPGFLESVRLLASKFGAVLVFDECTSGFRETHGGLHLKYGIEPDIAILGKTLGNGYAINAVMGRREVMEATQSTFISSTFWTERIGPTAGLAALGSFVSEDAPRRVHSLGQFVRSSWQSIASSNGLSIELRGLPALSTYSLLGYDAAEVRTLVTARMLAKGFLATTAFYASVAHTAEVVESYLNALSDVFQEISMLGPDGLRSVLPEGVAGVGFQRLN